MESCATCQHWKATEPDWEFDALTMGKCTAIQQREDIICPARGDGDDAYEDAGDQRAFEAMKAAKAIAVDGSGYYAALRTAADFGCVLHEPKKD